MLMKAQFLYGILVLLFHHINFNIHEAFLPPPAIGVAISRFCAGLPLLLICLMLSKPMAAQPFIPCMSNVPHQVIATVSNPLDVTINDDMLETNNYLGNGAWKAIAWGNTPFSGSPASSFYIEDPWSGSDIITLPSGAIGPDIVFYYGDSTAPNPTGIGALVTYMLGGKAYLERYKWSGNTASPVTPVFTSPKNLGNCDRPPHIDMFSDGNNLQDGLPSLHEFVVVWGANSTNDLMMYFSDVPNWNVGSSPTSIGSDCFMPDVAATTDISNGDKIIYITYGHATSLSSSVPSTSLELMEYNFTTGTPSTSTLASGSVYAPRIEAMSQYDPSMPYAKWQVAAPIGALSGFYPSVVYGFNDKGGSSGVDMSSVVSSVHSWLPYSYAAMGACVAAGTGPAVNPGNIGNAQYTVGFYPWQYDSLYARDVDATSGNLITPGYAYLVTCPVSDTIAYHWDLNQGIAVANSSNSGMDLLTAYFDGAQVAYKYSAPNTMSFRPSRNPKQAQEDNLQIEGNILHIKSSASGESRSNASYAITDMSGRVLINSGQKAGDAIDIGSLVPGIYLLRNAATGKAVKFTKQ